MPFKHNAARRHRIPRARYRVTNWRRYEAGLRRHGAEAEQPRYSDLAIELVLTLRLVFHLALRQAEAFSRSALRLLGAALPVFEHTKLSRRGRALAGRQPFVQASAGQHAIGVAVLNRMLVAGRPDAVRRQPATA